MRGNRRAWAVLTGLAVALAAGCVPPGGGGPPTVATPPPTPPTPPGGGPAIAGTPDGTTFLAGKPPPGQTYDGSASRAQISADGLWVVYHHGSENLVAVQQAAGRLPQAARARDADLPDEPRHRGHGAGQQGPERLLRQRRVVLPRRQRRRPLRRVHLPGHQPRDRRQRPAAGHLPQGHEHRGHLDRQHQHDRCCRRGWLEQPPGHQRGRLHDRLQLGRHQPGPRGRERAGGLLRHLQVQLAQRPPDQRRATPARPSTSGATAASSAPTAR